MHERSTKCGEEKGIQDLCREFIRLSLTAGSNPDDVREVLGIPEEVALQWERDRQTSHARGWSGLVDQAFPEYFAYECNNFLDAVRNLDQSRGMAEVADPARAGLLLVKAFAQVEEGLGLEALDRLMGWIELGLAQLTHGME